MGDIIQIIGDYLAEITGKDVATMRGLLRLAIKQDGKDTTKLTIDDLLAVFDGTLKHKLEKLNIDSPGAVIDKLKTELKKNQSLFVMMNA